MQQVLKLEVHSYQFILHNSFTFANSGPAFKYMYVCVRFIDPIACTCNFQELVYFVL